ncbi:hypothetical protein P3X46_007293 [Hevea brasiliensis]|uniref:Uncharacterized protein n=2 Tax=Hevea brasiliensis TaxID=3981 RepID=A0ABQ9MW93_HEVBR|nr:hypothetical protein P3X46_007293 [Hevea brasiliensis]
MCCYNELLIEFFIQDSCEKPSPSSKVNKCGVQLLYNDDGDDEWDYVSSWDPTQSSLSKEDSDIYDKPSTKNVGESSALLRRKSKHMKLLHLTRMRLIPVKHLALLGKKWNKRKRMKHLAVTRRKKNNNKIMQSCH